MSQNSHKFWVWYYFISEPTDVAGMVLVSCSIHRSFGYGCEPLTECTEVSGTVNNRVNTPGTYSTENYLRILNFSRFHVFREAALGAIVSCCLLLR